MVHFSSRFDDNILFTAMMITHIEVSPTRAGHAHLSQTPDIINITSYRQSTWLVDNELHYLFVLNSYSTLLSAHILFVCLLLFCFVCVCFCFEKYIIDILFCTDLMCILTLNS